MDKAMMEATPFSTLALRLAVVAVGATTQEMVETEALVVELRGGLQVLLVGQEQQIKAMTEGRLMVLVGLMVVAAVVAHQRRGLTVTAMAAPVVMVFRPQ
jgi:D-serine deaminase-like pyridoxal phosphate-dependent protein